jgi:hypothetical protein
VGVGLSHASGAVPSPGDGTGPGVLPTDYLGRDMGYHALPNAGDGPTYQPTLINPTLTVDKTVDNPAQVLITLIDNTDPLKPVDMSDQHTVYFYSLTSAATGFKEFPETDYVHVAIGATIWAYASHQGYNNSAVVSKVVT